MSPENDIFSTLTTLSQLKQMLAYEYDLYKIGIIDKKEYCDRVKPIDRAINNLEMSILQDTPDWKEAFLPHTPKPEH